MENNALMETGCALPARWWRWPGSLQRVLIHLVESELVRLRRGASAAIVATLTGTHASALDLVADLGADSLELMALTAVLTETLQLDQAGVLDGLLTDTRLTAWEVLIAAALDASATRAIVFRTSGSAGAPKPCMHALDTLWQEVAALAALLPARTRIVSAVPAQHIYGFLFTVLLPQYAGLAVVDVRGQVAAGVWQAMRPGDLVIGFPEFWQAALAGATGRAAADDVIGVSSTAPCPDALAEALLGSGLHRLLQVYGSSETAGVGWRDAAAAAYRCLPYWQRVADNDAVLLRHMPDGGVKTYPLQDRLAWCDGGFLPAGRLDDAVQVGGINVFPARVADLLRQHPLVADAAVRLMRADEGARLKAFVVGVGDVSKRTLITQLDGWLRPQLAVAERPASYTVGAALPRQRNGKLADWIIDDSD